MLISTKGHRSILVITDEDKNYLTKLPVHVARSEDIGEILVESIIKKYVCPNVMIKDQDSTFMPSLLSYLFNSRVIGTYNPNLY